MTNALRAVPTALLLGAVPPLLFAQERPVPVAPQPASAVTAAPTEEAQLEGARAALQAGRAEQAVRMAERYTSRNATDPQGFLVLGSAYLSRERMGRAEALRAFEEAIRLAPGDPEPALLYARAGVFIGGEAGEAIARRGLQKTLELAPLYDGAWSQWLLFRGDESRARMRELLARHDSLPEVRARIAFLLIEEEQYPQADSMLDALLRLDSTNVEWLAWRAQGAFEAGDTTGGTDFYVRALTNAEHDSTGVLWRQAVGVARPEELQAWERVTPDQRGQWLAAFWARRAPNLFGSTSARLAEHFGRLRNARRAYPLMYPLQSYHRLQLPRTANAETPSGEREYYRRCEVYGREPQVSRPRERFDGTYLSPVPLTASLRGFLAVLDLDSTDVGEAEARLALNLATGLDDRGLAYLRLGPPSSQIVGARNTIDLLCRTRDVEIWQYDDFGTMRFAKPSAIPGGDGSVKEMVFRAATGPERDGMRAALTLDASSEPAPLEFAVWTAAFAGGRPGSTEIAVVATRGALAASLVSPDAAGVVRRGTRGYVILEAEAGAYTLLAHAVDSAKLGRLERGLVVRPFVTLPALSDLLVAPVWAGAQPTRYEMLRRAERTRTFAEGGEVRAYAEVYGLTPEDSTLRYRAEYSLLRTDDPQRDLEREDWPRHSVSTMSFDRTARLNESGIVREVLDITPERLARGRYVLRLTVRDLIAGAEAGRSQITFTVR